VPQLRPRERVKVVAEVAAASNSYLIAHLSSSVLDRCTIGLGTDGQAKKNLSD
jgi:hypothetical protein